MRAPTPPPADRPALGPITVGWDDHRPFVGIPTTDPLARLARVSAGGELSAVAAGALAGSPRVYAFVHGWAPGSQATGDLIQARTGGPARAWDDGVVDMYGVSLTDAYLPLLSALAERDPEAAVLWFSWVDESATDSQVLSARDSLARTQINGSRLAMALVEACGGRLPRVQLIGHSHGSVVATHAAVALRTAPDQLTLLDCPEDWFSRAGGAAGLLADILPRLEPGRGSGQVLVDSYASWFGRPYHRHAGLADVVDVRLAAPIRRTDDRDFVGFAHEYAVAWYADTVRAQDPACGFGWSLLGAQLPDAPEFDPQALAAGYLARGDSAPRAVVARPAQRPPDSALTPLGLGRLRLSAERPDVLIGTPLPDTDLVEFDYHVTNPGPGTRIEAAVQRVLVFSGGAGPLYVPERGRYLRVPATMEPSVPVLLQFRLVDPGPETTVTISDLHAVRTTAARNYDATRTTMAVGMLGAGMGAAATLAAVGVVSALRRRAGRR